MFSESDLNNLLVRQKDYIIQLINANKLNEAQAALNTVTVFWKLCDYGYKHKELQDRINVARAAQIDVG